MPGEQPGACGGDLSALPASRPTFGVRRCHFQALSSYFRQAGPSRSSPAVRPWEDPFSQGAPQTTQAEGAGAGPF